MEKPQILLIGTVAIAIAFFALRFTGRSDSEPGYESGSGDRLAMGRGLDERSVGSGDGDARSLPGRGRDGQHTLSHRGGSGLDAAPGAGGHRSGSAATLSTGGRERRGVVGQGVGGGAGAAAREGGLGALLARDSNTDRADGSGGAKSDRMELLSGKSADVDPFYEGGNVDDNPDDDVVLEVKNADDADRKASDAVNVDEGDDGVGLEVGEDSVLTFPNAGNVNAKEGSISIDITPSWNGSDPTDNSLMQLRTEHQWNNRMQLVKNGPFLRFILTDGTGHEADISYRIDHWQPGEEYKVTATWVQGETRLFVNGQQVGTNRYPGAFDIPPQTPLYVGSDLPGGSYKGANGKLTAKVYNRALAPDEIF